MSHIYVESISLGYSRVRPMSTTKPSAVVSTRIATARMNGELDDGMSLSADMELNADEMATLDALCERLAARMSARLREERR